MTIDCSSEYILENIIPLLEKLNNSGDHDPATLISLLITKYIRKLAVQYKRDDTANTLEILFIYFSVIIQYNFYNLAQTVLNYWNFLKNDVFTVQIIFY